MKKPTEHLSERPPVIVIMGHIDHGKSTLLDYIRKTNIVAREAGGITQHVSAYEVEHNKHKITFLDTPGHEAFRGIRARGAKVADIAILVVSAEDGVKPQTLEALKAIKDEDMPYIVAINKIDRPSANVEKTKMNLAEHEIYLEGLGGSVPFVPISAKTGEGVNDLLDAMLLVAEFEELKGNTNKKAEGTIIESNLDPKKGISATLIITDGTLNKGSFVAAGESVAPVRIMEDFQGRAIETATFSSPIKIVGWSTLPKVGSPCISFDTKKEAEAYATTSKQHTATAKTKASTETQPQKEGTVSLPIIIKADVTGSLEAIAHEMKKIEQGPVEPKILQSAIGAISEGDVKLAAANNQSVIFGFNVKIDPQAGSLAERSGVTIKIFDIIYKLTEGLQELLKERAPKVHVEELTGTAKVLKVFSKTKDKQIIGGKVETGLLLAGVTVRIMRRDSEIGSGKIRELQRQKNKATEVKEGLEFGAMLESKIEVAPGDRLESFKIVEK